MTQKNIFVSHSVKEKELADALVDLIETGTSLKSHDIFCSSLEGLGIPSGSDFISHIKGQIQEPKSVILLLSENYFTSPFCLCEMGASWAMAHNVLPLLVPPLTYSEVKGVLTVTQIDKIDDSDDLNRFVTQLKENLSLPELNYARWEVKKKKFIKSLPTILDAIPSAEMISSDIYEEVNKKYQDAINEMQSYEEEIDILNKKIEELVQCKDSIDVDAVERKYSSGLDVLEAKFKTLKSLLNSLPTIVAYVMYKEFTSQNIRFNPWEEKDACDAAGSAVEEDYLAFDDEEFRLNHDDPKVKKVWKLLKKLDRYILNDLPEDDIKIYESENEYALSLNNRRLWHDELSQYMSKY